MLTIELTSEELAHLQSLSESEKSDFFETLTADDLDSVIDQIERYEYEQAATETGLTNIERRRLASSDANRRRREMECTVIIPRLTDRERKRREELEADNEAWIWEMCGPHSGLLEPFTRTFTEQQAAMIQEFDETLTHGGDTLLLASRGEGKTSYLRAMVWKSIATGVLDFIAFVSATGPSAVDSANAIKDMMQRSEPFFRYYPEIAVPAQRVGSVPQLAKKMRASGYRLDNNQPYESHPISFAWTVDEMDMPDIPGSPSARAMLRFRGADSPIRGLNILGRRPKAVAMDDIDTPDTTGNIDVAKKVIDRVNLDIGGLGTQTEPLARIMLATLPKSGIGVAHHFAKTGFPFVVKRYRYLIDKPDRFDMWMEYVKLRQKGKQQGDKYGRTAHAYYLKNRRDMDAGVKVSNEHRFKAQELPDGTQLQVSAWQNYFDEWADKDEMFCRCELDNETVITEDLLQSKLELGHVMNSETDTPRGQCIASTTMIVRGIDVRKTEVHFSTMASDVACRNRIIDYDVRSRGTSETTVEQAEQLIYENLQELAREWKQNGHKDETSGQHFADLTLIDKGWMGSWSEDGEKKTWARNPVERFCMEHGLRRFLPAKGAPNYRSPAPSETVIVGDNWHINRGEGVERSCTEVIWSAEHWHSLIEGLFMQSQDGFQLFASEPGLWLNHKRLAEHIRAGSEDLAELRNKKTRKPKRRRDHFWDSFAMMLVAQSIEQWFRNNLSRKKLPPAPPSEPGTTEDLGAR